MKAATPTNQSTTDAAKPATRTSRSKNRGPGKPAVKSPAQRANRPGPAEEPFIAADVREAEGASATSNSSPTSAREQLVHLEVILPAARSVCVAGSFNGWQPQADELLNLGGGKWAKDLMLPPGVYEYRLVVDGQWMPDPNVSRSVPNPFGEPNSVLVVPACESTSI